MEGVKIGKKGKKVEGKHSIGSGEQQASGEHWATRRVGVD